MKICIITNSHSNSDVRLYFKIGRSLTRLGEVIIISAEGVRQEKNNPAQMVVNAETARRALPGLYRVALRQKPDLVICVEPLTVFVGIALRRKLNCKVIIDIHEFFAEAFAERFSVLTAWLAKLLYLSAERWLNSKADGIIAVNEKIIQQAVPKALKQASIVIPNHPVKNVWDDSCEMPSELSALCDTDFDVVYIGGLTRNRGILRILQASAILRKDFPRLNVLILGRFHDAEVEKEFTDTMNKLSLAGIVYYQSWLPPDRIGWLLKRSRLGLWIFNPQSRRMRRALPLKVLEYCAAGLPVVSTKTTLMKALVSKNGVGEICEYTPAAIAAAIKKILTLPKYEYQAMRQRAIELVEKRYNWEALEPQLLDFINRIMN